MKNAINADANNEILMPVTQYLKHSVHRTPFSAREGVEPPTKFLKTGAWQDLHF